MTATVIYVSSGRENPEFEKALRRDLLQKVGELPIISVTQKPINFGRNICVGNVGASGFNFCRQNLIGCEEADTDFVISAESDCLYSEDYFECRPERLDIPYRNTNIYVQHYNRPHFFKKDKSTFSQVVGRRFYKARLEMLLAGQDYWNNKMKSFPKEIGKPLFEEFEYFETRYPCISFKTGKGMRRYSNSDRIPRKELPYWGKVEDILEKYHVN